MMMILVNCRLPFHLLVAVQIVDRIQRHLGFPSWQVFQCEFEIERGHNERYVGVQMAQFLRVDGVDCEIRCEKQAYQRSVQVVCTDW